MCHALDLGDRPRTLVTKFLSVSILLLKWGTKLSGPETVEMEYEEIEHDGESFHVPYSPVIECAHCGEAFPILSDARRPTCHGCQRKTERNEVGRSFDTYMKVALFSGEEESIREVTSPLRWHAEFFEAMVENDGSSSVPTAIAGSSCTRASNPTIEIGWTSKGFHFVSVSRCLTLLRARHTRGLKTVPAAPHGRCEGASRTKMGLSSRLAGPGTGVQITVRAITSFAP